MSTNVSFANSLSSAEQSEQTGSFEEKFFCVLVSSPRAMVDYPLSSSVST
jgi:hypothetical protein